MAELAAHNCLGVGSNPATPTSFNECCSNQ